MGVRGALLLGLVAAAALLAAPGAGIAAGPVEPLSGSSKSGSGKHKLRATIRRTKYGVPHIKANNIEALAAGYAYAFAEDNICTIANEYITVGAKRSKYFGPDEEWYFSGNGYSFRNLDADFYFKWVQEQGTVRKLMKLPPPLGPKRGVRKGVKGYVAGYNAYLKDTGVNNLPDETCRGADWVRKIKQKDVYRRFFQLGILASSGAIINGIVNATPTAPRKARQQERELEHAFSTGEGLEGLQPEIGSNAYGIGKDASKSGKGLLLGNPHFPWDGGERLYQAHLQIPGRVNVQGASLYGVPLILIGHTKGLAWSHTVATAWRFTPFKLQLPPGDPYSYIVDGETKPMTAIEVSVPVTNPNGSRERRSTTIYSTEYGPMLNDIVDVPLPWTDGSGFAIKDVNFENFRYLNHFYDNNKAQTVREYHEIQNKYQGIPWVNSIAADSTGESYYTMQGAIPHVPDELATECNVLTAGFETLGIPVLDGSRSSCDWQSEGSGVADQTFPPDEVPSIFRDDYVHNGNDSHWLTNPNAPITGIDRLIGIEDAERTYRTRIGLIQAEQRLAGTDGLPGKGFDRETLQEVTFGNRQYLGELWRDTLVQICDVAPGGFYNGSSGPVDVSGACDPLRNWGLTDELDDPGAPLFRRFATNLLGNFDSYPTGLQGSIRPGAETFFTTPYNNSDPLNTPAGLNPANPLVPQALADAVEDLNAAGIPLDAPLRGYQYETRGGVQVPIHGGPGGLGVFNAISASWRPSEGGYTDVRHGGSFIMAAEFQDGKCPVEAGTFVTYGQTENQASKHANDYTKAFSKKKWHDVPFCTADVKKKTLSVDRIAVKPRPGKR